MLEAVRRRATRLVPKIRKKENPERLEKLKLPSLAYEFGRTHGELCARFFVEIARRRWCKYTVLLINVSHISLDFISV